MSSDDSSVRLIAADSLIRTENREALPILLKSLDDPFLLNRQFARFGLESMLDRRLVDFGYRFYMTPEERREPIERLRKALIKTSNQ